MIYQKTQNQKGFTLIEVITAISIFMVVMTISMGSILGLFDLNRKSRALKSVMINLNLAMESMSREMRFGTNYHCGSSGVITVPQNCPDGESYISFLSSDDEQIVYRLSGGAIQKSIDGGSNYADLTGEEVTIDDMTFYVLGTGTQSPSLQPKVIIKVSGVAGTDLNSQTEFTLQTLVSQRLPEE